MNDAALLARFVRHAPRARSVSSLAREFGVGPQRLRNAAVAATGLTPGALLARERAATRRILERRSDASAALIDAVAGSAPGDPGVDEAAPRPGVHVSARAFLPANLPFSHEALANFLRARVMGAVEHFEEVDGEAAYRRAWRSHDGAGTATYRLVPDGVLMEVEGRGTLPVTDLVRRGRCLFDLDAPVEAVTDRLVADPLLAAAVTNEPGRRVPGCWDPFELSVRAVLGQQVSVAAARTHAVRLLDLLGVEGPDAQFPTPVELAEADLSGLAMPATRRETLRTLASAVADGRVDFAAPGEAVREQMLALRGIGPWTVDYVAMRGLKDPDAFPAGDLVVRQAIAGGAGSKLPSEAEVRRRAEPWQPVRAYAALHLWASLGAGG